MEARKYDPFAPVNRPDVPLSGPAADVSCANCCGWVKYFLYRVSEYERIFSPSFVKERSIFHWVFEPEGIPSPLFFDEILSAAGEEDT